MDFCFDFHLALISPPTPPHAACVLLFLHACEPAIWKGFGASPHNSLSDRHPPALSRHSSLTFPTSDSAVAEASNQRWHFAPLDVCSSMSLWRMKVKLWRHWRHLLTHGSGQMHWSLVLHLECCFPISGNIVGKHKRHIAHCFLFFFN